MLFISNYCEIKYLEKVFGSQLILQKTLQFHACCFIHIKIIFDSKSFGVSNEDCSFSSFVLVRNMVCDCMKYCNKIYSFNFCSLHIIAFKVSS